MTTEIIKGIIAVMLMAAAVASVFIGDGSSREFLIPLGTFVFGYYFKQGVETPIVTRIAKATKK